MLKTPQLQLTIIEENGVDLKKLTDMFEISYGDEVTIKRELNPFRAINEICDKNGNNAIVISCENVEKDALSIYRDLKDKKVSTPMVFVSNSSAKLDAVFGLLHDTRLTWKKDFDDKQAMDKFTKELRDIMIVHYEKVENYLMKKGIEKISVDLADMISSQKEVNKSLKDMLLQAEMRTTENVISHKNLEKRVDKHDEKLDTLCMSWGERKDMCECNAKVRERLSGNVTKPVKNKPVDSFFGKAGEMLIRLSESKVIRILGHTTKNVVLVSAIMGALLFGERIKVALGISKSGEMEVAMKTPKVNLIEATPEEKIEKPVAVGSNP